MADEKKPVPQHPRLNINPNTVLGSIYSQFTIVTVSNIDITINFAFIHPNNPTQGEIVARVTLPRPIGEDLAKTILMTAKIQNERGKEKKDGGN
jgi:hypothetical protein